MIILNDGNFKVEVLDYEGVVFVDFWSNKCPPCIELMPEIENFSKENKKIYEEVKFCKLDIEENPEVTRLERIIGIPTLVFYKKGERIYTFNNNSIDLKIAENKLKEICDKS